MLLIARIILVLLNVYLKLIILFRCKWRLLSPYEFLHGQELKRKPDISAVQVEVLSGSGFTFSRFILAITKWVSGKVIVKVSETIHEKEENNCAFHTHVYLRVSTWALLSSIGALLLWMIIAFINENLVQERERTQINYLASMRITFQ